MAASSLSVVSNANRLRRFHAPKLEVGARPVTGQVLVEVGAREPTAEEETMASVKDPVCGMVIDPATAAGSEEYHGTTYYFCSQSCLDSFKADPQKYAA